MVYPALVSCCELKRIYARISWQAQKYTIKNAEPKHIVDNKYMKNFNDLNLSPILVKSLARMTYETPTPIQAQAIPLALDGHDIMGSAQTGTGKTAAFAIPLIEHLIRNTSQTPKSAALVMTPTREIGKQIMDVMHQLLGPKSPIKTAFIIGGEPMGRQLKQLDAKPRLIVGTPGRINDHLERGSMSLDTTDFLVLDETDRMLDMGFTIQLEKIFKHLPDQRQTLMFSATLPKNILTLSDKYMNAPKRIAVGEVNVLAQNIRQDSIRIDQDKKYAELTNQLMDRKGSVIIFVKTKYGADRMARNLRRDGFTSEALHGDLRQNRRDKVMQNFRKQNFRILVATDIAARGLDVPHIEHVVNYDLPQSAEDFIHRMGRTARAGAEGSAISFIAPQDVRKWKAIERLLSPGSDPDQTSNQKGQHNGRSKKKTNSAKPDKKRRPLRKPSSQKPGLKKPNGQRSNDQKPHERQSGEQKPRGQKPGQGEQKPAAKKQFKKRPYKTKKKVA